MAFRVAQGFDATHPDIDLLRLRNFTIGRALADEEVLGEQGAERIVELLSCMKPFVSTAFLLCSAAPPSAFGYEWELPGFASRVSSEPWDGEKSKISSHGGRSEMCDCQLALEDQFLSMHRSGAGDS